MNNKTQIPKDLTLDFAKEVCNTFNGFCFKYKLNFEEETLVLTDTETTEKIEVVALDDTKLLKLKNEAAYIEFNADENGNNSCEINDHGIVYLRKLLLESEKINAEGKFARINYEREQTLKASIMSSQLSTRGCVPKLKMQSSISAMDTLPKSILASTLVDYGELKTYLPYELTHIDERIFKTMEENRKMKHEHVLNLDE